MDDSGCHMREYSCLEELINNLPYIGMIVLGAAILLIGLELSTWAWITAGAYFAYGLAGAFWISMFLCPYCALHGTRSCPCGYGRISAKLRQIRSPDGFREKFKKHIPVIVPLWIIPLLGGGVIAAHRFSWWNAGLLVVFVLNAFVLLPRVSTRHGCVHCAQRGDCPWMGRRKSSPASSQRDSP